MYGGYVANVLTKMRKEVVPPWWLKAVRQGRHLLCGGEGEETADRRRGGQILISGDNVRVRKLKNAKPIEDFLKHPFLDMYVDKDEEDDLKYVSDE